MIRSRSRHLAGDFVTVLVIVLAIVVAPAPVTAADPAPASSVVSDWERVSIKTIYPAENPTPIPVGVLYLGFTSLAMYLAATAADWRHGSTTAAVAQAAHDVLAEYFSTSKPQLDDELATSLDAVPDGKAKQRGIDVGAFVAHQLIVSRANDGRNDASIVYAKTPAPGVWQPPTPPDPVPQGGMLAPWLGFVRPLVPHKAIRVDGPDPITSVEYAVDYKEAKSLGSATSSDRALDQTNTAKFFNPNSAIMVGEALLEYLDDHPIGLMDTARMFAVMHTSMSNAVITCWRLKYDVGFWRPVQAIRGADSDGNPGTVPDPNWTPLIPNPPYSDYVSGHGCLTSPAVQTIRRTLGEGTPLHLQNTSLSEERTYTNLSTLEKDAFHARIWGGLHFRDAMDDAYYIGHQAADQVLRKLR